VFARCPLGFAILHQFFPEKLLDLKSFNEQTKANR
jgi:hypothetical protein